MPLGDEVPLVLISGKDGEGMEPTSRWSYLPFLLHKNGGICWLAFTTPLWLSVFCVALYCSVTETDEMGQTVSATVNLVLGHFKEIKVHGHNLSVNVKKGKIGTFHKSEWPAYNVGWSPDGTFQLNIIQEVHRKVFLHIR